MVLSVAADVNEIARLGKNFPWPKPAGCPRCHQALWWHGFVPAYFACLSEAVFIRRLRCSCCGAVHRLKPHGYWRNFRSSSCDIQQSIRHRAQHGRWRGDLPRERQRQWWRRLRRVTLTVLGLPWAGGALAAFTALIELGFIPVGASLKSENRSTGPPPYRSVPLPQCSL